MRNEPSVGHLPIELMIDHALLRKFQGPCSSDEGLRVRQELLRRGYAPTTIGMNPPRGHVRPKAVVLPSPKAKTIRA